MVAEPTRVAVIGAGVAGMRTALRLLARGVEVEGFDRADAPGGVWYAQRNCPSSRMQSDARFFVPGMLDDLDGSRARPTADRVCAAFRRYFENQGLSSTFRFHSDVREVEASADGLRLVWSDGTRSRGYAFVVHTSHTTRPRVPDGCGVADQQHTSQLTEDVLQRLVGVDGNVLVVGGGKSAYDAIIALALRGRSQILWASRGIQPVGEYAGASLARVRWGRFVRLLSRGTRALDALLSAALSVDVGCVAPAKKELNLLTRDEMKLVRDHARVVCGRRLEGTRDGLLVDGVLCRASAVVWATGYAPEVFAGASKDERYLAAANLYGEDGIGSGGFATAEALARVAELVVCDRMCLSRAVRTARGEKIPFVVTSAFGLRADISLARLVLGVACLIAVLLLLVPAAHGCAVIAKSRRLFEDGRRIVANRVQRSNEFPPRVTFKYTNTK